MAHFMLEQSLLREWIKKAKAGDLDAFERILILHERMVLRFAQRLLGNTEDAKDAAQEVFIRLHGRLGQFREEGEFSPWLYRMTVNVCHDIRRRRKSSVPIDEQLQILDRAPDPEQAITAAQQRGLIVTALEMLSEHERAAIVLRDMEGCATAEVAEILGSSETTVRSQISTGRAKMRNFIMKKLKRRV
jgi:RNA polymerase sigma-70 factor (ECF subfamily)